MRRIEAIGGEAELIESVMKKITIQLETHIAPTGEKVIVIQRKTGVIYTAQVGGLACLQNSVEGYAINVGSGFFTRIDTCNHKGGCWTMHKEPEAKKQLAEIVDGILRADTLGHDWYYKFNLSFDFDRIEDFEEAWIPVLVNGKLNWFDDKDQTYFNNTPAILFTSDNCD